MEFTLANLMAARPLNILVADDELHVAASLALPLRGAGISSGANLSGLCV